MPHPATAQQDNKTAPVPDDPESSDATEHVTTPSDAVDAEASAQISKEDKIAAAREKYLARKRQKTGR